MALMATCAQCHFIPMFLGVLTGSLLGSAEESGGTEMDTLIPIVNTRTCVTWFSSQYSTQTSNSTKQKEYMIIQAAICVIL